MSAGIHALRIQLTFKEMDFPKVIDLLVGFLEARGTPFTLVGGLALHAYGVTRATFDVDLVLVSSDQPAVLRHMEDLGYEKLHVSDAFSNHLHSDERLGRVDFIYVDEATARALRGPQGTTVTIGEKRLPVPKVEHLIAMKVHAMKNDPRRSLKERADIQALWRVNALDEAEVKNYFVKAGLEVYFDELKESL